MKATLGFFDSKGKFLDLFNPLPPFSKLEENEDLAAGYSEFLAGLIQQRQESDGFFAAYDPFSLPVIAIPLQEDLFLLLAGWPDKKESEQRGSGGSSADLIDEDLRERVSGVTTLYSRLLRSYRKSNELARQTMLLSAVEEINKLMLSLLNPVDFDLLQILDLVVNSLIILTDATGAWVFARYYYAVEKTVYRGLCQDFLLELKENWEAMLGGEQTDPQGWRRVMREHENRIVADFYQKKDFYISLGVVDVKQNYTASILSTLLNQIAIALEVDSLYRVLQKRIGELFNSLRYGIAITDNAGNLIMINKIACDLLSIQCEIPRIGTSLLGKGLPPAMEEALREAFSAGNSFQQKQSIFKNNAVTAHLAWDVAPLRAENDRLMGAILIIEDVTEKTRMISQIQEWDRVSTAAEIAASLAHEVRNPLATAGAAIQLFEMIKDETRKKELLDKLKAELDRMNTILTNFLHLSRPGVRERNEAVDVAEVLEELSFLLRSEACVNDIDLVMPPIRGGCKVMADRNNLKQVFINIAKNAFEAMREGGTLNISLEYEGNRLAVTFEDNGPGIAEDALTNIFKPFFTTKPAGTGLGLSISYNIIKKMGGDLTVESEPGRGTRVRVSLPV